MKVIELHENVDEIPPLLPSVDSCILELLLPALDRSDPFTYVPTELASNKVTGSLLYLGYKIPW